MSDIPDHYAARAAVICIQRLIQEDALLFALGAHEQAVSHRLAQYLQVECPDATVDVEYNRHGIDVKTANLPSGMKRVVPDIVLHDRGNDGSNHLVIELKIRGRGNDEDRAHAHHKLHELVHGDSYCYEVGLFVEFGFESDEGAVVYVLNWYVRR